MRIRLLEIGEAVKALPAELLSSQPAIPWAQIARMRDHLAHRYFDTDLRPGIQPQPWQAVKRGVQLLGGLLLRRRAQAELEALG